MNERIKSLESEADAIKREMVAEAQRMADIDRQLKEADQRLDSIQKRIENAGRNAD